MSKITMQNVTKEKTFEEAFKQFQEINKIRNLSEETIAYYNRCMNSFAKYFDITRFCKEIDITVYNEYIKNLQSIKTKDVTINTLLRGLRAILNFCMNEGYMNRFEMILLVVDTKVKETYTQEELSRLLKKPNLKECTFVEYRTFMMFTFAYGTCLRLSSILNIKNEDVSLNERKVIVKHMKNREQREYPLSAYLCKLLREYMNVRGGNQSDYLFCNQFGKKLNRSTAEDAISAYNRSRQVTKTSIHLLRNNFAKEWLLSDGDMLTLQKMLGHKTLAMVLEYVEMFDVDVKRQYDKHNPLEQFAQGDVIKIKKKKR